MTDERVDGAGTGRPAGPPGHPDDASRGTASLYALGARPPGEARSFQAHLEACAACAGELAAFRTVLLDLGRSAGTDPPSGLRARLLARIAAERGQRAADSGAPSDAADRQQETQVWKKWSLPPASPASAPGLRVLRSSEGSWEPTAAPGVSVKPLHVDAARRYVTMLVRMEPGSSYPGHRHGGAEECYVLEGELRVGEDVLGAGDFQRAEAGSEHVVQSTEKGCVLLIVSSQDDELV
jgi:anti-sigma factor ChrR (cupin superfamily)